MASGAVCVGSIPIRCIFLLQKTPLAASGREPGAGLAPQVCRQPLWFFQKGQGIQNGCGTQVRTAGYPNSAALRNDINTVSTMDELTALIGERL